VKQEVNEMQENQFTLKELRARKNLTQAQVAEDLGVSVQTYNAWERDISNVAVSKVKAVAKYYGVTLGEIFLPPT
jgi:transcriptional regulator with XRE-family HTH domain